MMNLIKKVIKLLKKENKNDINSRIEHLRNIGVSIGEDVHFYGGSQVFIDEKWPWMLTIGNHVHLASGVRIICHDYLWSVGKNYYHEVIGGVGKVVIGNNVNIGTETIVLMNTEIGDNVIIGANSVVSGKIPSNCVAVGSPARPIMTLDEYWNRRKERQYKEAVQLVVEYKKRYGVIPPKEKLPSYFYLFEPRDKSIEDNPVFKSKLNLGGNYEVCLEHFLNSEPMFDSYESFLKSIVDL